jgi:hypothetical protein
MSLGQTNAMLRYPNQGIGLDTGYDPNVGNQNVFYEPLLLGTVSLWSGVGVPTLGGNKGDLYIRQDGTHAGTSVIYQCTASGLSGAATWAGIV